MPETSLVPGTPYLIPGDNCVWCPQNRHSPRARTAQARLDPHRLRSACRAHRVGRKKGYCSARLAENAAVARHTPAPHRPPNAHARRLHYVAQSPRKALHRDHLHKTSDTGRVGPKCEWHRELLRRADSRRPGRSSSPHDGMTQMTQMTQKTQKTQENMLVCSLSSSLTFAPQ